jgi:CTP:molybdopterin cytidylyltransferase MocA
VLLAAGSGRRFGGPKALADTGDGPWVRRALATLDGLAERIVVVGAAADRVRALLPGDVTAVTNPDHAGGMGSSLQVGLRALQTLDQGVDAAVVMLVDLPDVPAAAVQRVVAAAGDHPRTLLARATYRGTPGHPVLIGADHIAGVLGAATGDRGARDYLASHPVLAVECGDLAGGMDVDAPPGR